MEVRESTLFLLDEMQSGGILRGIVERIADPAVVEYADAAQCLSDALNALYVLRGIGASCRIAAEGRACPIALAVAAQLMVDRLVLCGRNVLPAGNGGDRRLRRIEGFALRNMSLVTADVVLIGADETQLQALRRMLGRRRNVRIADDAEAVFGADLSANGFLGNI